MVKNILNKLFKNINTKIKRFNHTLIDNENIINYIINSKIFILYTVVIPDMLSKI